MLIYPRLGRIPGNSEIQPQGIGPEHDKTVHTDRSFWKRAWVGGEREADFGFGCVEFFIIMGNIQIELSSRELEIKI